MNRSELLHLAFENKVIAEKQEHIRRCIGAGVWGLESKLSEENRSHWGEHGSGQRLLILKFLNDHDAWDTNFVINKNVWGDVIIVTWGRPHKEDMWASFYHQTGSDFMKTKQLWSMYGQLSDTDIYVRNKGEGSDITVSEDFKQFIRGFN